MAVIVKKFGGSCLQDDEAVKNAARIVAESCAAGNSVIAVVSAQGDTTDRLIGRARRICAKPSKRELDVIMSAGEQLSASLLTLAVQALGVECVSLLGWQAKITTVGVNGAARIREIDPARINKELGPGRAVVIAGFQGVDRRTGDMTTLGRGGSDTTAVAVAAVMGASKCEIYSRIDGIYTADPEKVPEAKKLKELNYEAMQQLAFLGVKVLNSRAVELAKKFSVVLEVRSAFSDAAGTQIKETADMETMLISGVTKKSDVSMFAVRNVRNSAAAFKMFGLLEGAGINVDIILQSTGGQGRSELDFTVDLADADDAAALILNAGICAPEDLTRNDEVSKVSVVGIGMESHHGAARAIFEAVSKEDIPILMLSSSELRFSLIVAREEADRTVRAIHRLFVG